MGHTPLNPSHPAPTSNSGYQAVAMLLILYSAPLSAMAR